MKIWTILLVLLLIGAPLAHAADIVSVSLLGSPGAVRVIAYTHNTSGVAQLRAPNGAVVQTITLHKPTNYWGVNVSCQGNMSCLVGELNATPGTYRVTYGAAQSPLFPVNANVYANAFPLFLEWFNMHMMQESAYHARYFGAENPKYRMMADGAFVMEASQASIPLIRLGNAYRENPTLFAYNKYNVLGNTSTPDGMEYIVAHVQYLRSLQANNGRADPYMVPLGYTQPWGPWFTQHPNVTQYTVTPPTDFITFSRQITPQDTPQAAYAFLVAAPAVFAYNATMGSELVTHAIGMLTYVSTTQNTAQPDVAAYLGAGYFAAYNVTGNWTYIEKAYALRTKVDQQLGNDYTKGEEFYWMEYVRYEQEIRRLGFEYPISGRSPAEIIKGKLYFDYKDRGALSISDTGEHVYEYDRNIQFSNSRYMLLEAVFAAKTAGTDPILHDIADSQLAWLTGANAVQSVQNANQLTSVSFISGIGKNITEIHSRVTPARVRSGEWTFTNGMTHIPGWINGAYDYTSDSDIIRNYNEQYSQYWHTETTNEMVSLALELVTLRDKYYNNKPSAIVPIIVNQSSAWPVRPPFEPPLPPATTCSTSLASANATCENGLITSDAAGGCRVIICTSGTGSLQVMACDKATFFEMYKQTQTDPTIKICLDSTCIQNNGFAKSNLYAACGVPAQNATLTLALSIVNDDGGSLTNATISLNGNAVAPGTYTLTSGAVSVTGADYANYTKTVTGDCTTLAPGQHGTCTVQYNDIGATSCVTGLSNLPATCSGTVTTDLTTGCRTIACTGTSGTLTVTACDKPGSYNPTHFEIYRQSSTGTAPEICIGATCMRNEGFVKSPNYPICGTTPVCTDIDADTYAVQGGACGVIDCRDTNASIHPGAVELCNAVDDDCDGAIDENACPLPVCGNGIKEQGETCDDGNTANGDGCSSTCQEEINASVTMKIAPWFPQGRSYVFICEAAGFAPTRYDFSFGDGHTNNYRTTNDVYYTYGAAANVTASCTAYGTVTMASNLAVAVQ